jgi:hypothetical protein
MKEKVVILALLASLFFISLASAQVSLSEPLDTYNLGDRIYVTANGIRGADSGNLNINLICGNQTTNLLKVSARVFSKEEDQLYPPFYKILNEEDLEVEDINSILGSCQVSAFLGPDGTTTKVFIITDKISIDASVDKLAYNPSEGINFELFATKANGDLVEGFIEVNGATEFSKAVIGGSVVESFSLPETSEAGDYTLNISVYDEDSNHGEFIVSFEIKHVASLIETSISALEVTPGETFTIGEGLFDQSGMEMSGSVRVEVLSPEGEEIILVVPSGDFSDLNFPLNTSAGTWTIRSSFDQIVNENEFEMLEIQKVGVELEDSTLIIRNIGNTEYNKTLKVLIGGEEKILELKIGIGEERRFGLGAPAGEYSVVVEDDENLFEGSTLLTGKAVSIKDLEDVGIFTNYSLVWVFLILILGAAGVIFFIKFKRTKRFGVKESPLKKIRDVDVSKTVKKIKGIPSKIHSKLPGTMGKDVSNSINFTNKSPEVQGLNHENEYSHEDKSLLDLTKKKNIAGAESTLVLKGEKNLSSVVCLNIRNYKQLGDAAKKKLLEVIGTSKEKKGLIDWKEDHIFVVFSPLVTKTYDNEILASKTGFKMAKDLGEYNRKFNDKILFNVGIHSGELIASKQDGKLKYTSIGNTIALAKRISDSDKDKVLVSESVRKKIIRDLRAEKVKEIGKNSIYSVSEVRNREANEAKLKDLLKRMDH